MGHRVISFCGSVRGCGLNLDKNLNANNLNSNNKIIGVEGQVVKKDSDENQWKGKLSRKILMKISAGKSVTSDVRSGIMEEKHRGERAEKMEDTDDGFQ